MRLDHIGIAVNSIEEALKTYQSGLGFSLADIVTIDHQKVRVAVMPLGEYSLELLEPTDPLSPIRKFLDKRGEGIHHLCFQVRNLAEKLQQLEGTSVQVLDAVPCRGLENRKVAFLHPKSTHGVLIEFVEEKQ
ncbi:MAG: methylmalonyl-CoA epimerase [Acidobacteria bacterium]|nr:MAG: methylmalonyl-CoA epimerase [Acidobacteriota bacterium]